MNSPTLKNIWKAVFIEGKVAGLNDWLLLVQVFFALIFLSAALRFMQIEKLLKTLKYKPSKKKKDLSPEKLKRYVDAVLNLNVKIFKRNCLKRSLTIYYFMQRAGVPVRIHFGVNKEKSPELSGHGWLTLDGHPYLQSDNIYENFQEIYSYS